MNVAQARIDLAAAFRLAARYELEEGIDNHFSFALPGDEERYLFNVYGKHWSRIRASDLIVVDGDGMTIEGNATVERTAFCIHVPIHRAYPRARAVLHTHMPHATALSLIAGGTLEPVDQNALRFFDDIAYDERYDGLAFDPNEGVRLAKVMDGKRVLIMANHGVTVVGESIARAFNDLYFLERACRVQCLAKSWAGGGHRLRPVERGVAAATKRRFDEPRPYPAQFFAAMKAVLDEDEPDYRS